MRFTCLKSMCLIHKNEKEKKGVKKTKMILHKGDLLINRSLLKISEDPRRLFSPPAV